MLMVYSHAHKTPIQKHTKTKTEWKMNQNLCWIVKYSTNRNERSLLLRHKYVANADLVNLPKSSLYRLKYMVMNKQEAPFKMIMSRMICECAHLNFFSLCKINRKRIMVHFAKIFSHQIFSTHYIYFIPK